MWRSDLFAFKWWSRMGEKPTLSLRVQFQCFKFGCEKPLEAETPPAQQSGCLKGRPVSGGSAVSAAVVQLLRRITFKGPKFLVCPGRKTAEDGRVKLSQESIPSIVVPQAHTLNLSTDFSFFFR